MPQSLGRKMYRNPSVRMNLIQWIDSDANPNNNHYASQACDENVELRASLDSIKQLFNGQVGVVESGMDCDCSSYHREYLRPMFGSVAEYKRWLNQQYQDAEGPHSVHIVDAHKIDRTRNCSRDLALEAHEDGHAHSVTY